MYVCIYIYMGIYIYIYTSYIPQSADCQCKTIIPKNWMKRKIHREFENPWKSYIWGLNPTSFRLGFPFNHSLELSLVSYRIRFENWLAPFHHFHPKGHNWGSMGVYSTPSSRPQTYWDFIPTVRPCSACSRKRQWDTALFAWSNVIPATKTH